MEKFIFLDLDGVLNYHKWWNSEEHYKIYRTKGELESHYDPEKIELINYLLDNISNSKLIISSSWKSLTPTELKPYGDYPNGIYDILLNVGIKRIDGKTPHIHGKRDEEIMEFLKRYKDYKFVILDDEDYYTSSKYHDELYCYWIKTNYLGNKSEAGLTKDHINKIIELLK